MPELTPKVYHMELRRDDGIQSIIIEDDFNTLGDQAAVKQLDAWAREYIAAWHPEHNIVGVVTNVWTEECLHQPTYYCWARYEVRPLLMPDGTTSYSVYDCMEDGHIAGQRYTDKGHTEEICEDYNDKFRRDVWLNGITRN
jgi:hypothetical protein